MGISTEKNMVCRSPQDRKMHGKDTATHHRRNKPLQLQIQNPLYRIAKAHAYPCYLNFILCSLLSLTNFFFLGSPSASFQHNLLLSVPKHPPQNSGPFATITFK